MIHGHGGNIYAMARQLGCRPQEIIDLSSNINPLGMPSGLLDHLKDNLEGIGSLPEVDGRIAVGSMASLLGVDSSNILAGNGTTQFIYTACQALNSKNVLIVGPTYADYADACHVHHIQPRYFLADADALFEVHLSKLDRALSGMDTAFICNPNNPTGRLIPHESLIQLCRSNPKTRFIIDESYMPFVPIDHYRSMANCDLDNVSVLWSLSKIFGVPGLRAGFLIARKTIIDCFYRFMQPWSLNSIAQSAIRWLGDHQAEVSTFMERSRDFLEAERQLFYDGIGATASLTPFPSLTSYILLRLPQGLSAANLCHRMGQNRLLIRNCSNFHGLSDQYVRLALKDSTVNHMALKQLVEILG